MDFATVLAGLKAGKRYARNSSKSAAPWGFIFLIPASTFTVNLEPLLGILGEGAECRYHAHICRYNEVEGYMMDWIPNYSDLFAEDWQEIQPVLQDRLDDSKFTPLPQPRSGSEPTNLPPARSASEPTKPLLVTGRGSGLSPLAKS